MKKISNNRGAETAAAPKTTVTPSQGGQDHPQLPPAVDSEGEAGDGLTTGPNGKTSMPSNVVPSGTEFIDRPPLIGASLGWNVGPDGKPRELPMLSEFSHHILEKICLGEVDEFIGDEWETALCTAADEALDVANVLAGGLSLKEWLAPRPATSLKIPVPEMTVQEQEEEEEAYYREWDAARADVRAVEVLTYMRSNSSAGVYAFRVIWPDYIHENAVYCPNTTGPALDRAAIKASYERLAMLRATPGFDRKEAELFASRINRGKRPGDTIPVAGHPVRERIRGGRLVPCADPSIPLTCKLSLSAVSTLNDCQEVAMRSYWMRRSIT